MRNFEWTRSCNLTEKPRKCLLLSCFCLYTLLPHFLKLYFSLYLSVKHPAYYKHFGGLFVLNGFAGNFEWLNREVSLLRLTFPHLWNLWKANSDCLKFLWNSTFYDYVVTILSRITSFYLDSSKTSLKSSKIGVVLAVYVHKQKIKMEPSVCLCTANCIYNHLLPKE